MAECLNNIVTSNFGCEDPVTSLSGYDLSQAPELSKLTLSATANETYITGAKLAQEKLNLAILDVKNDMLGLMAANKMIPSLTQNISYETSNFDSKKYTYLENGKEKGFSLYKVGNERLKRLKLTKLHVYPVVDVVDAEIKIYDSGQVATYTIDLVGGEVNTIDIDYILVGNFIRVLADIDVYTSKLICQVGCNGAKPNECAYTKGFNGDNEVSAKEGYGLGVEFNCYCDYDNILCDLSRQYIGKIVWLKARMLLIDEMLFTDRLNNWTVYNTDRLKDLRIEVANEYTDNWNTFVNALPVMLKTYNGQCLTCTGSKWVQNI